MEPLAGLTFNRQQARTLEAIFECMFPADATGPGASEIGVVSYLDQALAGAYADHLETYRLGLLALDQAAQTRHGAAFAALPTEQQTALLSALEQGDIAGWTTPEQWPFFELMRAHLQEGLFADPLYGGNRDKLGWRFLGHPGVWLTNTAAEQLAAEPVTKGGVIQSLADVAHLLATTPDPLTITGYDPTRSTAPTANADVVIVGMGGVGGFIAPVLAKAGLRVVGLEAGPWRTLADYLPDELGATYYGRAKLGPKFLSEIPRWRRHEREPTRELTFSLGRMMNGVGGSIVHYGGWLRRYHPHHFRFRSFALDRWGAKAVPDDCTLVDWPLTYDELESYLTRAEHIAGVAGDAALNPLIPRGAPYPLPPTRPFRLGELFGAAATRLGLHPYPTPIGMTTRPYHGLPEMTYAAWNNGFGSWTGDKWHPGLTCIPEALATGNLDLRTHCRVVRIVTDGDGRARGVEYVDGNGQHQIQVADTVILAAYTFESVRLLFLSGDAKHDAGLGNNQAQLGKHFMTKQFPHVDGYFPHITFNRHTGPASQAMVLDDFLTAEFDSVAHGFLGGATLGAENQFLPIQIARESLPPDVARWGAGYKAHLREWQHLGVVRLQADALSYHANYLDLDPRARDRSGLGLPLLRVTYDLRPNEHRIADYFETKCEEILREMGATKTWRGARFTGAGSSHDLGGCRMGNDPASSVVDADLRVHDTPGLYIFSGAVMPTCPGINPTLTLWAVTLRAAERLIARLTRGEEP